jgi:hypothetical protein
MADAVYDFLSSGGSIPKFAAAQESSSDSTTGDPVHDFLASGGANIKIDQPKKSMSAADALDLVDTGIRQAGAHVVTSLGSSIAGGHKGLFDLIRGKGFEAAAKGVEDVQQAGTYQPINPVGQAITQGIEDRRNPINYPAVAAQYLGDKTFDATGSPAAATVVNVGVNAAPALLGMFKARGGAPAAVEKPGWNEGTPQAPTSPVSAPPTPQAAASSVALTAEDTQPISGGIPPELHSSNADVLRRIGLENARTSAVQGNALEAATDAQLAKFTGEPAGKAAFEQLAAERQALENHATSIVKDTGGTIGLDQGDLKASGKTIAKPFDDLNTHFDQGIKNIYDMVDKRASEIPNVPTTATDALFNDRSFKNSAGAHDLTGQLNSLKDEFENFKENNPEGLGAKTMEQYRQFLNQAWDKSNPAKNNMISKIKEAVDSDVFKVAGEDIYKQGRDLYQLKQQTLDNPKGVAKIMDYDPHTPINRATAFEDMPDKLLGLPSDQFNNIVDTLRNMPDELQPQAHAALKAMQAHVGNKLLEAGSKTQTQWNAPKVTNLIKGNSENIQTLFADNPEALQKIQDLQKAGNILRYNQGYPGAAAQAQMAMKQGFLTRMVKPIGTAAGGAIGSILGPWGASAGSLAGETAGVKAATSMGEKAAVKNWGSRVTPISDVGK